MWPIDARCAASMAEFDPVRR